MNRIARLTLLVLLVSLVAPTAAMAAPRMWLGFQDDPYFRWLPERFFMRDRAVHANSTIMKTTVYWFNVAPRRPANAANPFDPAYRWEDLDEFVRQAQDRDIEAMLTIWGTPSWAGPGRNRMPRRLADLTNFARALSTRYSGRYRGYPYVRFYSVWNEPNLTLFLAPQFDSRGRSVAPGLYARLYRAAFTGLKAGSPTAQVAIGETSARGRDRDHPTASDTHSPGKFAELLAKARPRLRFDAYAHHPYSSPVNQPPTQIVRWPNVSMTTLTRFGTQLDKWFGRKNTPIWLTEYGHETRPETPRGVTYTQQASFMRTAFGMARRNPRVSMLIWFIMRDNPVNKWQSGLMTQGGLEKPAFDLFSVLAKPLDARNLFVNVKGGRANPSVRIPTAKLAYRSGAGARVGLTYRVFERNRLIAVEQPVATIARDGWITIRPRFTPVRGRTYTLQADVNDANGNTVSRTLTLVGVR
ncbi:MAG TPA: cellulase family glycosylhydrolase [Gaiellaceae bacterium]|nr:cellulase family glycosylhydrolase [Gaiellaceae bacterium]